MKNLKRKIVVALTVGASTAIPVMADATSDSITTWMPTIITFAMLGLVLGLLKKFSH